MAESNKYLNIADVSDNEFKITYRAYITRLANFERMAFAFVVALPFPFLVLTVPPYLVLRILNFLFRQKEEITIVKNEGMKFRDQNAPTRDEMVFVHFKEMRGRLEVNTVDLEAELTHRFRRLTCSYDEGEKTRTIFVTNMIHKGLADELHKELKKYC